MLLKLFKHLFGTRNDRLLRQYQKNVIKINQLEDDLRKQDDASLAAKTTELKDRVAAGESLDSILCEAFALVREAARRTLGLRHFDVQLLGGMVLHYGNIAEMRTGEGKTLASTLPVYLNALTGKGVHIVTVNDYLASRDAEWMRPIYDFLGMSVGVNLANMSPEEKQAAYAADITYGTNNEFGFDYLRDNMVFDLAEQVQRPLHYAVIDEVDSILIDEARTPLIISGQAEDSSDLYQKMDILVPKLVQQVMDPDEKEEDIPDERRGDYIVDEKNQQVHLTETGHKNLEALMVDAGILEPDSSLYAMSNITLMHYMNAALRAHALFKRDVHYVVKNNEVLIVDEHTGRLMDGRRWSDGLHQAVEAKEHVEIQLENQTMATITFQNYFRLYEKLSGMTGTADTEAFELQKIYGLEVVVVPTNRPMLRDDRADKVYLTQQEKYQAILDDIRDCQERQQPVLVGTASIESSEILDQLLKKEKIPHEVLNAKQHQREAQVIAQAGRPGSVTIATNMAGRGTDIVLGGSFEVELAELREQDASEAQQAACREAWQLRHDAVKAAGGLHVLGTERHESRRIDNQLRGRSGRQGDPGSSQFYLSLEDNLLRIFAVERMSNLMRKIGVKEGDVIQHPWISRAIENAQQRVENLNFDMRKQLLEYDDVANDQRKVIYQQRLELLETEDISSTIIGLREEAIQAMVSEFIPPESLEEQWNVTGLEQKLQDDFGLSLPVSQWLDQEDHLDEAGLSQRIVEAVAKSYEDKLAVNDAETMRQVEKSVMLQVLDQHWKDHLAAMDHLRQGIHLRGYAQKNPAQEYKRESFGMFTDMLEAVKYELTANLARVELISEEELAAQQQSLPELHFSHDDVNVMPEGDSASHLANGVLSESDQSAAPEPFKRQERKVGRNEPCPCNSGKKYKQCHGKI